MTKTSYARMTLFVVVWLALGLLVSGVADAKGPKGKGGGAAIGTANKVSVCHVDGKGRLRLINVSQSALLAHQNHGDLIPGTVAATVEGGYNYVGSDCGVEAATRVESPILALGALGWGSFSCPEGTTVYAGGYEPAEATVLISEAARPDSVSGMYPVYPHYTFTSPETGWVVQNGNIAQDLVVFAICIPTP